MSRSAALIVFLAAACSKSSSNNNPATTGSAGSAAPAPSAKGPAFPELAAAASKFADDFPEFDASAVAKKLQGTWVFKGNGDAPTVWSIEGTKVTEIAADGKTLTGELELASPCTVELRMPDGGHPYSYAFIGDALHMGLGHSGVVVGKTTYACNYPSLVRKTGDTCDLVTGDESRGGKLSHIWEATPCTADATKLTAKDRFGSEFTLKIEGSALFNDQLKDSPATKVANLDEGKAKLAEMTKK